MRVKEDALKKAYKEREYQSLIKKELETLKREERLENVARIAKANEYQNKLVSDKIEMDKIKGDMIMKEK